MNRSEPTIYLVDDDAGTLKALSRLLSAHGFRVRAFGSAVPFLNEHDASTPGCIILDLAMPDISGLELQEMLSAADGLLPIIFLSGRGDVPASVRAMKRGAVDFLTKPVEEQDLIPAVHAALQQNAMLRHAREELAEIRRRVASLTPREYQVFEHVISGSLNKQTAADLGAAEKTIKIHRARVMEKMQVRSVAELVRLAEHAGIDAIAVSA